MLANNNIIFRFTLTSCAVCEEVLCFIVVVHRIQKRIVIERKRILALKSDDFDDFSLHTSFDPIGRKINVGIIFVFEKSPSIKVDKVTSNVSK